MNNNNDKNKPYNDDAMYDGIENLFEPNSESGQSQLENTEVIPEDIESDGENTYEGIAELFEENPETISRFHDDSVYEGTSELFSENNDIGEYSDSSLQEDNPNNNISNEDNPNDASNENNPNDQDNTSNDGPDQDSDPGFWGLSREEQLNVFNNPGQYNRAREQVLEARRLDYEERIRARITQEDVDADNFTFRGLSDLLHETREDTIEQYEPYWSDNLGEMSQLLREIATRREYITTNTNPVTVDQEVIYMGMCDAFDFMIDMCITVYNLNLPEILG